MVRIQHFHCCVGVVQMLSCVWLCDSMVYSTPGSSVLHYIPEFAHIHVSWVGDAICLILCHCLLLLPSVFPSIRVFSSKSALHNKWPKYWSFSISPSNKYSLLWLRFSPWLENWDFASSVAWPKNKDKTNNIFQIKKKKEILTIVALLR